MINMKKLMELAITKYETKNTVCSDDYVLSLNCFILKIFSSCDPASYGKQYCNKLIHDLRKKLKNNIDCVSDSDDRGDMSIRYYPLNMLGNKVNNAESKYYEIKISYLSKKTKTYRIRNIRPYQNLNGYILTFVDCDNSFKEEIYLLSSDDLFNKCGLTFTYMNGTKGRNEDNTGVGFGTSFRKGSDSHNKLRMLSKLETNDYDGLVNYFINVKRELKNEFCKINKKSKSIPIKFGIIFNNKGLVFNSTITTLNYLEFIKYVLSLRGPEFLVNTLHPYYVSVEPIDYKQVYRFERGKDRFYVNTYCSNKSKKRNIELLCEALGCEIIYLSPHCYSVK